jgi:hypothetical protein
MSDEEEGLAGVPLLENLRFRSSGQHKGKSRTLGWAEAPLDAFERWAERFDETSE